MSVLEQALLTEAGYIGMIGSRNKRNAIYVITSYSIHYTKLYERIAGNSSEFNQRDSLLSETLADDIE